MQAAPASSSDDDDEMPLGMLPKSALAAKRPVASLIKTPASLASPAPQAANALSAVDAIITDPAVPLSTSPAQRDVEPSFAVPHSMPEAVAMQSVEHAPGPAASPKMSTAMSEHTPPAASLVPVDIDSKPAEGATEPMLSLGLDHAPVTAAIEAIGEQGHGALPEQAVRGSLRGGTQSSSEHAQQQVSSPQPANAVVDNVAATNGPDLISDSESEGEADAGLPPQQTIIPRNNPLVPQDSRTGMTAAIPAQDATELLHCQAAHTVPVQPGTMHMLQVSMPPAEGMQVGRGVRHLLHSSTSLAMEAQPGAGTQPTRATTPLHDSSESLQQAEAEAARLALLLAPGIYRQPAQAQQLAVAGRDPASAQSPAQSHSTLVPTSLSAAVDPAPQSSGQPPSHAHPHAHQSVPESVADSTATAIDGQAGRQQPAMQLAKQHFDRPKGSYEDPPLQSDVVVTVAGEQAEHPSATDIQHTTDADLPRGPAMMTVPLPVDAADLIIPDR